MVGQETKAGRGQHVDCDCKDTRRWGDVLRIACEWAGNEKRGWCMTLVGAGVQQAGGHPYKPCMILTSLAGRGYTRVELHLQEMLTRSGHKSLTW
eukprot:1159955-Pelagomonas_calceolata.AAC.1